MWVSTSFCCPYWTNDWVRPSWLWAGERWAWEPTYHDYPLNTGRRGVCTTWPIPTILQPSLPSTNRMSPWLDSPLADQFPLGRPQSYRPVDSADVWTSHWESMHLPKIGSKSLWESRLTPARNTGFISCLPTCEFPLCHGSHRYPAIGCYKSMISNPTWPSKAPRHLVCNSPSGMVSSTYPLMIHSVSSLAPIWEGDVPITSIRDSIQDQFRI